MVEPGLDRHEWESQWASLEEDFDADPADALRQVHELMTRALMEREILDDELVTVEGADPELVRPWAAARDLSRTSARRSRATASCSTRSSKSAQRLRPRTAPLRARAG